MRVTNAWHRSTYEWHTDDIRIHTSDIWMTYKYIRVTCQYIRVIQITCEYIGVTYRWHKYIPVTYGWHTSTYEWHTVNINVQTALDYLPKKVFGISFWYTFSAWDFHVNAPYFMRYQLIKFQRHIFLRYQTKCAMKFWSRWFIFNHPLKIEWVRCNEGKSQIQKIEYLKNKKDFLHEVKSIFYNCFRAIICWIKRKLRTQALSYLTILPNNI